MVLERCEESPGDFLKLPASKWQKMWSEVLDRLMTLSCFLGVQVFFQFFSTISPFLCLVRSTDTMRKR